MNRRRLTVSLVLTLGYMIAEVVGAIATGSLALFADAGHMLSDAAALGLSLFALWISSAARARRRPTVSIGSRSWPRCERAALIAIAILIVVEAIDRFRAPQDVHGPWMLAVAAGGLAVNVVGIVVLSGGRHDSLNMRGAWLTSSRMRSGASAR